jgi:hypothetical protein
MRSQELIEEALRILQPAYLIRRFPIESITDSGVVIGGQSFRSRIVANKLQGHDYTWMYIATSGKEISEYLETVEDPLDKYILDQIAYFGCVQAMEEMTQAIDTQLGIARHIKLSPGSIIDWSVEEVKKFFLLLEGDYQKLGVRVLDSGLIDPLKSVSGVLVAAEEEFESCDICERANCPNRKTPFDEEKYSQMINL